MPGLAPEHPMSADHYDVIVIGSGPGGASLAHRLAPTGKRILMLERGDYLPRSRANWDAKTVFVDGAYQAAGDLVWRRRQQLPPRPALLRRRQLEGLWRGPVPACASGDFGEVRHKDGVSPGLAARLRRVRAVLHAGRGALSCARAARRGPDRAMVQRALRLPAGAARAAHPGARTTCLTRQGLHPFHLPLGIKLDQNPDGSATTYSPCIRCDAFDGFPCAINAKADAQVICVDPDPRRTPQLHAADRRLCGPAGNRPGRAQRQARARHP